MKNKNCNECNDNLVLDCGCKTSFPARCVIYQGEEFKEYGVVKGDHVEGILEIILNLIQNYLNDLSVLGAENIGDGAKVYKRKNYNKILEFRTFVSDDSIDIIENQEEIEFRVNKEWFDSNIPEQEEFVLNSPKQTILIDDNNVDINPSYFESNDEDLLEIYEESNKLKFKVKPRNLNRSVGTGEDVFIGTDASGENKFRTIKTESTSLDLSIELDENDGLVIKADTYPEDPNMKYFYVNVFYTGEGEDGSIGRPYKTLDNALNAYIGTGSAVTPQYIDTARIILMSDVEVDRKLYVNKVNIDCNGFTINYRGTDNYYIDSEYLANTIVGYNESGNLRDDVRVNFKDLSLVIYNEGAIKHKAITSPNGRNTGISLKGTTIIKDYSYNKYRSTMTNVKDVNGNDVTLFGGKVYKMPSNGINIPIIHNEGYVQSGEGSLNISNLDIELWNNTAIRLIGTSFGLESLIVRINSYNIPYSNLFEGRLPYGKEGLYVIHNQNSWLKIDKHEDNSSNYVEASPSGIRYPYRVSQLDGYIYLENTLVNKNRGDIIIKDGYIYSGLGNNFIKLTKNTKLELDNCDYSSFDCVDKFIVENTNTTETTNMTLNMNYSNIKHMGEISNLNISAAFTIVNQSVYTTYPGFTNDTDAKNSGLIKNNMYFNTTSNSFTRIL